MDDPKNADMYGPDDRPPEDKKVGGTVRCRLLRLLGDSVVIEGDERLITEGIARQGVVYVYRCEDSPKYPNERIYRELKMVKVP